MGLFTNPLGHAGYPPGAGAPAQKVNSTVRSATAAEAAAGVRKDVYISPATRGAAGGGTFGTLSSTGATTLATAGTLGFFAATAQAQKTQAALTNSVVAGGVTGTIADFAGTTYATDGPIIRADIYQLSLALANVVSGLRSYGLFA